MTVQQIADRVKTQFPHSYDDDMVLTWVNDLERVIAEVFTHYVDTASYEFTEHTKMSDTVQLARPEIYVPWVISQICLANEEYNRYNNHIAVFDGKYNDWKDEYIRTHMPVQKGRFIL